MQASAGESHILSFSIIFAGTETGTIQRCFRSAVNRLNWPDRAAHCYRRAYAMFDQYLSGRDALVFGFELRRCFVSRQQQSGQGFRFIAHESDSIAVADQKVFRKYLIEEFNKEFKQNLA